MEGVKLYRHSECGHVISWRAGGVDWLEPYLVEPMQEGLRPMPESLPRRVPIEPYNKAMWQPRTTRQP